MAGPAVAVESPEERVLPIDGPVILMTLLLGVVAFLVVTPLVLTLLSSFQISRPGQPAQYGLQGWLQVLSDPSILSAINNTFSLAIVRQFITLVVGVFLAWLIARTDLPWKDELEFLFWISFFLPALPVAMGWMLLLDGNYGLVNQWLQLLPFVQEPPFNLYSFWGIVWVHITTGLGVKVMLLAPAFRNLDAALEETSRGCGATMLGTFRRIVIPIMTPAILVTTLLGLIRALEAFEIELLLGLPIGLFVYSTKIRDLVTYEPPQDAPATALGTVFLVVLLLLVAFQRWYIGRRMYRTMTGRGFSTRASTLGGWRHPALALVVLLALAVTVIPMIMLVMGTFMTAFGYFDIPRPWTLDNWQRVLADPVLVKSFRNTLVVGAGSALIGVAFYALIAYVIVKTRFAGRHVLDLLSWLPWAIPGILMGLALLWMVFQTRFLLPIYGTVYLLILALVIKSMPVGVQLIKTVLLQLGDEFEEASRISGGSWLQTYRRIVVPLLVPTLLTTGLVAFMSAARDISTIVLLGSSESRTLALLMLDFGYGGQFEKGTVVAVITVLLVVVAAFLARLVGGHIGIGRNAGH